MQRELILIAFFLASIHAYSYVIQTYYYDSKSCGGSTYSVSVTATGVCIPGTDEDDNPSGSKITCNGHTVNVFNCTADCSTCDLEDVLLVHSACLYDSGIPFTMVCSDEAPQNPFDSYLTVTAYAQEDCSQPWLWTTSPLPQGCDEDGVLVECTENDLISYQCDEHCQNCVEDLTLPTNTCLTDDEGTSAAVYQCSTSSSKISMQ